MQSRDRPHVQLGPTRRRLAGLCAATILVGALTSGCGTQVTPPASALSSPQATAAPAPTAAPTPAPAYADTLRLGVYPGVAENMLGTFVGFRQASSRDLRTGILDLGHVVHGALYRQDARFDVVPDLADGPCEPRGDGTVIRCHLVETTFHDGTPLTADDVVYSFELHRRPAFLLPVEGIGSLTEARIVDPRTVDFVLSSVDPTFLSSTLPAIPILPRHAVEAAYAALVAGAKGLEAAEITKLADTIDEELGRDPPVCATRLDEVGALLDRIGVRLYREDFSLGETGAFDACAYMGIASGFIRQAAAALSSTGIDAVAAAYRLLSIEWRPIGAGPYRLVSEDAGGIHLEAWPGYHGGLAATRLLDFLLGKDLDTEAPLLAGRVDIVQAIDAATLNAQGIRMTNVPQPGFFALQFNVRPGRLFAERELRRALQLCIDLERTVDAAQRGAAMPVYGPVLPGSWADEPALPKPARDVAAARELIEGAGWVAGEDGIYTKDGVRLGADILVRGDRPARVKVADLIAQQAGDCGMDLQIRPLEWSDILAGLMQYPHNIPGTDRPFDLYIGAWEMGLDPGTLGNFSSSQITDATHPDANASLNPNWLGFVDPTFDRLVAGAMATYDQVERARAAEASDPLRAGLAADTGRPGGAGDRPARCDALDEESPTQRGQAGTRMGHEGPFFDCGFDTDSRTIGALSPSTT